MKKTLASFGLVALLLGSAGPALADVAIPDAGPDAGAATDDGGATADGGTSSTSSTGCSAAGPLGAGGLIAATCAAAYLWRRRR